MLHDISDHYPIYLTVSKARLEKICWCHYFWPRSTRNSRFATDAILRTEC